MSADPTSTSEDNKSSLCSVEDMINNAVNLTHNKVNYKLIQAIFHLLARQMRMLKSQVDLRICDLDLKDKKDITITSSSLSTASPTTRAMKEQKVKEKAEQAGTATVERDAASAKPAKEKDSDLVTVEQKAARKKERDERAAEKEKDKEGEAGVEKGYDKSAEEGSTDEEEHARKTKTETSGKISTEEREKKKAEKEKAKLEKEKQKEEESMDKKGLKEKEKEVIDKMSPEEKKKYEKEKQEEKEKEGKIGKDKSKKEKEKEREKIEKMSPEERTKYEKEMKRAEVERTPSATGVSIKESERQGEKVLVVQKGPTTYGGGTQPRVGSVDCVTRSEFELLEASVNALQEKAGPLPMPAMPDNKKLLDDITRGSASLTDTMQAMQMAARLQGAEEALGRMAGLLTELASAGALPKNVVQKIGTVTTGIQIMLPDEDDNKSRQVATGPLATKNVAIDPITMAEDGISLAKRPSIRRASVGSTLMKGSVHHSESRRASCAASPYVTQIELGDAMTTMTNNLKTYLAGIIAKAKSNCDAAIAAVKAVEEKMAMAAALNSRLNNLLSLVTDYSEQLNGFDAGLTTQMSGFQEQIAILRKDMKAGLVQLEQANSNAESAALLELRDRYEALTADLDNILNDHGKLDVHQNELGEELRDLVSTVEILREQKSDRDEVVDALRDKAALSQLQGLLTDETFAETCVKLNENLERCHLKFHQQDDVWMGAIKDLSEVCAQKADLMQLLAAKEDTEEQLNAYQERLSILTRVLGEPRAVLVTRQVSKDAACGPCRVAAQQPAVDSCYGKPRALPAARPAPLGREEPCAADARPPPPPDTRTHICHRWVGGSHTLLSESVRRVKAPPVGAVGPPVCTYTGLGTDGRLYRLESEIVPCVECSVCYRNKRPGEEPPADSHIDVCICDDLDEKPEETQPSPAVGDGAGDSGSYFKTIDFSIY